MKFSPHAPAHSASNAQNLSLALRLSLLVLFSLIALLFLGHGLLIAGNYFTYSKNHLPPTLSGKILLLAMILAPILVSGVLFRAAYAWGFALNRVNRTTVQAVVTAIGYVVLFVAFCL